MSSENNYTTDICKSLHISILKETHRIANNVNYVSHILRRNDHYTALDGMEVSLYYLAWKDWYDIYTVTIFNSLSAIHKQ